MSYVRNSHFANSRWRMHMPAEMRAHVDALASASFRPAAARGPAPAARRARQAPPPPPARRPQRPAAATQPPARPATPADSYSEFVRVFRDAIERAATTSEGDPE
jgi:hypothetical protein